MCKYCHQQCEGDICINCMHEQNAILWNNDECVDANSLYALWGILKFICIVALIIIVLCNLKSVSSWTWFSVSIISLVNFSILFDRLRKMYKKQMGVIIDREMRKNH